MKLFTWVHRRFRGKGADEGGLEVEEVKNESIENLALLENAALANVLDGWKEGILTIGTLGFDHPLKDFAINENEDREQDYDHGDNIFVDSKCNEICEEEQQDEGEMDPLVVKGPKPNYGVENGMKGSDSLSTKPNYGGGLKGSEERKKRGERITLADLFSADSLHDMNQKQDQGKLVNTDNFVENPAPHSKNGISGFAKKIVPRVKEDSRHIKKLNRLMTKMLKRKIHPDLESKIQKETQLLGLLNQDEHACSH